MGYNKGFIRQNKKPNCQLIFARVVAGSDNIYRIFCFEKKTALQKLVNETLSFGLVLTHLASNPEHIDDASC